MKCVEGLLKTKWKKHTEGFPSFPPICEIVVFHQNTLLLQKQCWDTFIYINAIRICKCWHNSSVTVKVTIEKGEENMEDWWEKGDPDKRPLLWRSLHFSRWQWWRLSFWRCVSQDQQYQNNNMRIQLHRLWKTPLQWKPLHYCSSEKIQNSKRQAHT